MKRKRQPRRDRNRELAFMLGRRARDSKTPITAVRALDLYMDRTQAEGLKSAWSDGWTSRDLELRGQGSFGKDGE